MLNDAELPQELLDSRARNYPLILPNGFWNIADVADWLKDGQVVAGPWSGRGDGLLFGDATYADLVVYNDALGAYVSELQREEGR